MRSLESVEVELVPGTLSNVTVIPDVEPGPEVVLVTPGSAIITGTGVPAEGVFSHTGPVVLWGVVAVNHGEVFVPVLTVVITGCSANLATVLDSVTSVAVHVPDAGWDVTLFCLCLADVTERLGSESVSVRVLAVMVWCSFVGKRSSLPVDAGFSRFGGRTD